jgi:hypothetical protein
MAPGGEYLNSLNRGGGGGGGDKVGIDSRLPLIPSAQRGLWLGPSIIPFSLPSSWNLQSRCKSRSWHNRAPVCIAGGGGGGGGGGGDEGSGLPADIVAILGAKNIATSALPKDVAAAVLAGRVGASEVAAWAAMYTGTFRKLLASLWPGSGLRNRIMANDRFMLVLLLELGIGCVSKMAAGS